jgi:hypothetical protein
MNTLLGSQEYLAGPLSLAEAHVAASVYCLKKAGQLPGGLSNIDAWFKRIEGKMTDSLRSRYLAFMA